eukprot:2391873-Lingulodinium_polyedra.AAC.1
MKARGSPAKLSSPSLSGKDLTASPRGGILQSSFSTMSILAPTACHWRLAAMAAFGFRRPPVALASATSRAAFAVALGAPCTG